MPNTVKLPIVGTVNKGTAVGVSIGGLAVAGYLIVHQQKKNKAAAAKAAAAQAQTAQAASGYGYGALYPAGYYGYGEPGYNPYGYGAMGYPQAGGGGYQGYYGYGTPYPNSGAVTTNAQWSQAAINQLTGEGYSAQTVSAALGKYLTGAQVTAADEAVIQAAIGVEGYPPQPGANDYPPAINMGGGGGGGQGGGTVMVPSVLGMDRVNSKSTLAAAGLVYQQANVIRGTAHATAENPTAGTQVASGSTVVVTMSKGAPTATLSSGTAIAGGPGTPITDNITPRI